jgi:MoaA/NifB/PqqE/SkfB family radical SAM enzyme
MCGQWSEEGYIRKGVPPGNSLLQLEDWMRLADEAARHQIGCIMIRGGEPFLFPGMIKLLDHIHQHGIFAAIDTNGTLLGQYAEDLVRIGHLHVTISVDGPESIHDQVRGVPGCFRRIRESVQKLSEHERKAGRPISKAICFVISPWSVKGLGEMPDVARSLGIETIAIVPYYFVPQAVGQEYEKLLREQWGCSAFSWRGFRHETSGMDMDEFCRQWTKYKAGLKGLKDYPYMAFSEADYRTWFADARTPVGPTRCQNVERLIDIQPNGDANFCVDFPDYILGNVRNSTIESLWTSDRAQRFREYRRAHPLPICHRCGAKYMAGA